MATITVNEGQHGTANAGDDLVFPNITSCLTITLVMAGGVRHGAHLVFQPAGGQSDAATLAAWLATHDNPTAIYMIGEIGTWNTSLEKAPKGSYHAAGDIVAEIGGAVDCYNAVYIDTNQYATGGKAVEIRFLNAANALQVVDHTGTVKHAATW